MKNKDLKRVVDFHENVTMKQIIKPVEINEIYLLIYPDGTTMQPYMKKQGAITTFVHGLKKEVLDELEDLLLEPEEDVEEVDNTKNPMHKDYIPEDSAASPSVPDDTQSHSEDVKAMLDKLKEPEGGYYEEELLQEEIDELQKQYEGATSNEKRSITMKIKAIKKKIECI